MMKRFTQEEAAVFMNDAVKHAAKHGMRLGQAIVDKLPSSIGAQSIIFYSTDADMVSRWFYENWVEQ